MPWPPDPPKDKNQSWHIFSKHLPAGVLAFATTVVSFHLFIYIQVLHICLLAYYCCQQVCTDQCSCCWQILSWRLLQGQQAIFGNDWRHQECAPPPPEPMQSIEKYSGTWMVIILLFGPMFTLTNRELQCKEPSNQCRATHYIWWA